MNITRSGFGNSLDYKEVGELDGSVIYELNTSLVYYSKKVGRVEVPALFQTDLASVPRVPFIYMMWGNKAHREAVLHDYLYRTDAVPAVSFAVANSVFKEAMISRNQPGRIYNPMYWGVCLGGKSSYHRMLVMDSFKLDKIY